MQQNTASLPLVLLGAGGHAKVLLSIARELGREVVGVCDPGLAATQELVWRGIRVLGNDAILDEVDPTTVALINGIGQLAHNTQRQMLHQIMSQKGFRFASLVHSTAWVDTNVKLGEGVQIMAGAVIQADCVLGDSTIINTCASIDHDCYVGSHVHVAPGATVCGDVQLQNGSFIGCGSIITPGVTIGAKAIVGAGSVVLRDVLAGQRYFGIRSNGNQRKGIVS